MPPVTATVMLAGIMYGGMYGGTLTSVLINVPGEAASVMTAVDGHQLARQGRAGSALSVAAVGSFLALVPRVKAVVFTAGVGENDAAVRAAVCAPLAHLGFGVDDAANDAARGPDAAVRVGEKVLVVPTDEEAEIAAQVLAAVGA